ncbi:unnamed protein product, partial [Staurois parvus]
MIPYCLGAPCVVSPPLVMPISDACQCPPVIPVNAHQCHLPV